MVNPCQEEYEAHKATCKKLAAACDDLAEAARQRDIAIENLKVVMNDWGRLVKEHDSLRAQLAEAERQRDAARRKLDDWEDRNGD